MSRLRGNSAYLVTFEDKNLTCLTSMIGTDLAALKTVYKTTFSDVRVSYNANRDTSGLRFIGLQELHQRWSRR